MGQWLTLPQAEAMIVRRIQIGDMYQGYGSMRIGSRRWHQWCEMNVKCHHGDVANMADIEGADFDVINEDILDYHLSRDLLA